jgi:hypothetical protein
MTAPSCTPCPACRSKGGQLIGAGGVPRSYWERCPDCAGTGHTVLTSALSVDGGVHALADRLVELCAEDRQLDDGFQLDGEEHANLVLAADALRELAAVRAQLVLARKRAAQLEQERDTARANLLVERQRAERAETAARLNSETLRQALAEHREQMSGLYRELAHAERRQLKAVR